MKQFPLDIFGSRWVVYIGTHDELTVMDLECSGYTDVSVREIGIQDVTEDNGRGSQKDLMSRMKEVMRHEITHAALLECGLRPCRNYDHEQIADWVCMKIHDLHAVITSAESTFDLVMKEPVD